ncbi:MAG: hypothetical protein KatS3mg104_0180 [Phycisphaerae bacterium]|nr:MAG: hypothetical protein KatS3mg104_0180 [Phycisphaerae bacterium]
MMFWSCSLTEIIFNDNQIDSIIRFVRSGKGIISIHTAAGTQSVS